jgi:C-terminal processing protease CtpA/Prc
VTQVGGRSGGGGGMPETYYLPNGWALIFPSNVLLDVQKQHIENGIEPDVEVHISREDKYNEKDVILEKAIELLLND